MHTVDITKTYISVTFNETPSLTELSELIISMYKKPGYATRNAIWIFNNHVPGIHIDEFSYIESHIQMLFPPDATRTKTAIVASPGLNNTIAQLWKDHAQAHLPYEIEVFPDLSSAQVWVAGSSHKTR